MNFFGGVSIYLPFICFQLGWGVSSCSSFIFLGGTCLKGTFEFLKFVFEIGKVNVIRKYKKNPPTHRQVYLILEIFPTYKKVMQNQFYKLGTYNDKLGNRFKFHIKFVLLHDHYVQKESGTRMATVLYLLLTVSAWLSVAQLQMPEEQLSW